MAIKRLIPSVFSEPSSVVSGAGLQHVDSSRPLRFLASGGTRNWTDRVAARMGSVGIDLLEIDRLERALARRPRLEARLFTDGERAYAAGRHRPAMHLAARFCAKEAVVKALALEVWNPHDVEVVSGQAGAPHDVEVVSGQTGAPTVRLAGRAAARAAELGATVAISLTHTRGMAGAVALVGA